MADGGHFEGGVTPQQQIQPVVNTSVPESVLPPTDPVIEAQKSVAADELPVDTNPQLWNGDSTKNDTVSLLDVDKAQEQKIAEDAEVSKALHDRGEPSAVLKKMELVREKMRNALSKTDAEIDELLKSDAGKLLEEVFYEAARKEQEQLQGTLLTPEQTAQIRAEALQRARKYERRTGVEVAGELVGNVWDNIDGETFLLAIVGHSVGSGYYGNGSFEVKKDVIEHPSELIKTIIKRHPDYTQKLLYGGARACQDLELLTSLTQQNFSGITTALERISVDKDKSIKFIWGMNNLLGQPQASRHMTSDVARECIVVLLSGLKDGAFSQVEGDFSQKASDISSNTSSKSPSRTTE